MINKIFDSQLLWIVIILGLITSCEQEDNIIGSSIVGGNAANFEQAYIDLTATTMGGDTIRSDRGAQINATIGAFSDPVFGMSKSSYYTQVRLGSLNPQFGENAEVDSVVLSIPVYAKTDTITFSRKLYNTSYVLKKENNDCSISETRKQYLKNVEYKMDSVYGDRNANMTLNVYRVTENMGTIDSVYYSNKNFNVGELFGSKTINDNVIRTTIVQYIEKNGDSNSNAKKDSTVIYDDRMPMIKVRLDGMKSFVQNEIVNKQGSANLSDQISFISNVLKGIKIEVAENNGFVFNIIPSNMSLIAYVSSKNPQFVDANGNGVHDDDEGCTVSTVLPKKQDVFNFMVGSSLTSNSSNYYNVTQNEIKNTNGTIQNVSSVAYLKGMGGAKVKLSLKPEQVEQIRDNIKNKGWVINEAHIKVYPETGIQAGRALPTNLHLYNYTQKSVLSDYGSAVTPKEYSEIQAFPYVQIAPPYNQNEGYYMLRCTEFFKNIVEKNAPIDELMLEMGAFVGYNVSEYFYRPSSPFASDRIFNPYRLAIVGPNPDGGNMSKKLQLEIYYSKK